jgi:hypothetical protein
MAMRSISSTTVLCQSNASSTNNESIEATLPHLQRPTDQELEEEEPQEESHMKDGLAIKMATSSFAGRRRYVSA